MSRTHIMNLHSTVARISRNSLLETGVITYISTLDPSLLWGPGGCYISDVAPVLNKEILDIQATIGCRFTLKCVCDMIRTYSHMHRAFKYSQHSSITWPVWLKVC